MKNCGNCKYYLHATHRIRLDDGGYGEESEWYCNNDESLYECERRDHGDSCEEWVAKWTDR